MADTVWKRLARRLFAVAGLAVALAAGWFLFVRAPGGSLARLLGIVLAVGVALAGLRLAARIADSLFAPYNVASVPVEGPITRTGATPIPDASGVAAADRIVEKIEQADADANVEGLILEVNTPGGEIVPGDDVRLACEAFDGPTVAFATDTCASGGYWIASGCDRVIAREGTLVGSIGVVGSLVNARDLADRLGLSYERFAAGRYKDTGTPLRELDPEERSYLQGLVDDYYESFVDRVAEGRDLAPEAVRETEARVYLASEARELGLVDDLGDRTDAEDYLAAELDAAVEVRAFAPERGMFPGIRSAAVTVARAFGAGLGRALAGGDRVRFR